jgi:hypothetical protein
LRFSQRWLKSSVLWVGTPCSLVEVYWHFGGTHRFHSQDLGVNQARSQEQQLAACTLLVSRLAYTSTLKMEAIYSSETSVNFYRITQRYIATRSLSFCASFFYKSCFFERTSNNVGNWNPC